MTNYLDSLLARVADPELRDELTKQVAALRDTKQFGLVYEKHLPEIVRLDTQPIRPGTTVRMRSGDGKVWTVEGLAGQRATITSHDAGDLLEELVDINDLVAVREFGQPIYPGLKPLGAIERGGEKPSHAVINAENYHALETLLYAYEGRVDCIYIDPPYNTGARDWKYNNDYVDSSDAYRHSKWLAMMERRLDLARRLLNPSASCLVVTIDEKEVHRLGLLLRQIFPAAAIQLVTIVINPNGSARAGELARVEEYALFVFLGDAAPGLVEVDTLDATERASTRRAAVRWEWLLRGGSSADRASRPNLFYPVYIDPTTKTVAKVGDPLPVEEPRSGVPELPGLVAVWPLRTNGSEGRWRVGASTLRDLLAQGHAKVGAYDSREDRWSLLYLGRAQLRRISTGELSIVGREPSGAAIVERTDSVRQRMAAKTVWNRTAYRSGEYGSSLLQRMLPSSHFPYPKSLYAVEDALRVATRDLPNALVVDFFAGSGTTAHAVMRLNHQDGGQRQSILVTNNEIGPEAEAELAERGLAPGDGPWEAEGIFHRITRPRLEAAVTGLTSDGTPLEGDYGFTDEFPLQQGFQENVEFFDLEYLDRDTVARGSAFEAIAPLLWMKAGAIGARIDVDNGSWAVPDEAVYGVLFNTNAWGPFAETVRRRPDLRHVFVVTDSWAVFQQVVAELPPDLPSTMLYEDYLSNFEINTGGPR